MAAEQGGLDVGAIGDRPVPSTGGRGVYMGLEIQLQKWGQGQSSSNEEPIKIT